MSQPATHTVRQVPCPGCGQPALYSADNRWRPFCSQRCRTGDLGAWATERYRVPATSTPDTEEPAPPPAAPAD